ncbi:MAG: helix-turn-helix domain-containing protein [Nanoarchaeota archaeon]
MKQNYQEIEVWYILPTIRRGIVKGLLDMGLSQNEVSKRLGLRKSTISQYVHNKRGKEVNFDGNTRELIKIAVQNILDNNDANVEIANVCNLIKTTTTICDIHRMYEDCPSGCEVCLK